MISLLNGYFVSVYISNDDYAGAGSAPREEREALEKIYLTAGSRKLNTGSVRGYVTTPEGDPIVCTGGSAETLIADLKGAIKKLGTREGKPVVEPRSQNPRPGTEPDALALHLTSRPEPGKSNGSGFWHDLIGEDWIVYSRKEWTNFLPADEAAPGTSWDVDRTVASKLLNHFYPTVEDFGPKFRANDIKAMTMKATLVSNDRVRLDVSLQMGLYTYPHPGGKPASLPTHVNATATGVVDIDPAKKTIKRFIMATEKATMNGGSFAVAVRSVP